MTDHEYLRQNWQIPGTRTTIDAFMFEEHPHPPSFLLEDYREQAGFIVREWAKRRKIMERMAYHWRLMVAQVGVGAIVGGMFNRN